MIGIAKGDIMMMMKINEVNTMTPRQNDLVVKKSRTRGRRGNVRHCVFKIVAPHFSELPN